MKKSIKSLEAKNEKVVIKNVETVKGGDRVGPLVMIVLTDGGY